MSHIRDEVVTTRKPHVCLPCGELIIVGSRVTRRVHTDDDNQIQAFYQHDECKAVTDMWSQDDWECSDAGDLDRPVGKEVTHER